MRFSKLLQPLVPILVLASMATDDSSQPRTGGFGDGSRIRGSGAGLRAGAARGRAFNTAGIESRNYLFEEPGDEIEYFIYVSHRVHEDEPSPLLVALHGMGVPPELVLAQIRDEVRRHGFIAVAPMGFNLRGGYGAYPAGIGNPPDPRTNRWSEQDVMQVLGRMREEFNVDEKRIYLLGQSMGGAGALHLGTKYPDIWAAVGATAAAVVDGDSLDLENARSVPFILVHGKADRAVPIDVSRRLANRMDALGPGGRPISPSVAP
jgi:predicted peptidase